MNYWNLGKTGSLVYKTTVERDGKTFDAEINIPVAESSGFEDGSIVFKPILTEGSTSLYTMTVFDQLEVK